MRLDFNTLKKNKETLQRFTVGQNVILHDVNDCRSKFYGHVIGFVLNPAIFQQGELMVRISLAAESAENQLDLDPETDKFTIEVINR